MNDTPLRTLRTLCLGLPEAREVEAWGAPTFRVRTMFTTYSDGSYDVAGRKSAWVKTSQVNQDLLVRTDPDRFFVPPYLGPKGWVGVFVDSADTNWDELKDLIWEAWKISVPKKLLALHPEPPEGW